MQLDTKPLIDAINRLIEKADDDLKDSLEAEGYVAASELVKNIKFRGTSQPHGIMIKKSIIFL